MYTVEENRKHVHASNIKRMKLLDKIKSDSGCVICGEKDPVVLDFHHVNPQEKEFEISYGRKRKLSAVLNEIEKCVVVCRNCHAKIHAGSIILPVKTRDTRTP